MNKDTEIRFVGPVDHSYSSLVQYATIQECYEYLQGQMIIGEDIETTAKFKLGTYKNEAVYKPGLDPYLSKVVMLQLGTMERVYVIDTRVVDISPLLPLWQDRKRIWVGVNLKFEAKHLLHNYDIVHNKIWDTMLVDQNLTNGLQLGYSMEKMAQRYLGIQPVVERDLFTPEDENEADVEYLDKSIRMGFLNIGDKPFTENQILYGAGDITIPLRIYQLQQLGYNEYNPVKVHELENEFCLVLADIELKGMTFDQKQWLDTYTVNKATWERRGKKLNEWVEKNYSNTKFCRPPDIFDPLYHCSIEWTSSKQVVEFFRYLDFCPREKSKQTKKIEYTVGAKALLKLLPADYKEKYERDVETEIVEHKDLILNYLLFNTAAQSCTTFGEEFLKYVHPITGRLHSNYKQILNTGRISSSAPNLQNIPQNEEFRKAFVAPDGYQLVDADYSAQEVRDLAEVTQDPDMCDFFNNGHPIFKDDFHSWTATKMFSLIRNEPDLVVTKKTHPKERDTAKAINFKLSYGGTAFTLKDDFGTTEEVAQEFIDGHMNSFPTLKQDFQDAKEAAVANGYVDIIPDRRYWFKHYEYMLGLPDKIWKYYPDDFSKMNRTRQAEIKKEIKEKCPEVSKMWSEYFLLKGSLERCALNYRIQGLAGAQTKMAGVLFRRYQIQHNLRDKVYLTSMVHDECLAEAITDYAEQGLKLVIYFMEKGGNKYCKKVNMTAAGNLCPYWGH